MVKLHKPPTCHLAAWALCSEYSSICTAYPVWGHGGTRAQGGVQLGWGANTSQGTNAQTLTHPGQFGKTTQPTVDVFGLQEETG